MNWGLTKTPVLPTLVPTGFQNPLKIGTYGLGKNFMVARVATVPSSITTQEQLAAWAVMALEESASSIAYTERPGVVSWAGEWQSVKGGDGQQYFVGRVVIPMTEISALPSGNKVWLAMQENKQGATIPTYYASN